ncbi:hypothetical protein ACMGD3_24300 [Lysinibacillus sphaericus]|uniref:hypothetical protein n=1 Tax=Lysinibacillus sphaericus TaxID=1421 RepID=UPI003F7B2A22
MRIGECDLCEEQRYLAEGRDAFGIHVLNLCAYGCSDNRSIPQNENIELDRIAACMNCVRVLKPEDELEYTWYFNSVFCSQSCVIDCFFDEIQSTTLKCNELTEEELRKYNLKVKDGRLFRLDSLERYYAGTSRSGTQ